MKSNRENKNVSFAGVVAGGSKRTVALALWLGALTGAAHAQFDRLTQEIELKRLDHHPKGSFLREHDLRIRGVLDAAFLVADESRPEIRGCRRRPPPPRERMGQLLASELRFLGTVPLDGGWFAQVDLAHGFNLADGTPADDCGRFFDRTSLVGIGHRSYGRIQLGRREQPAWGIALMADPFGGSSVASPGDVAYYRSPAGRGGKYRVRSDDAVTLTAPYDPNLAVEVQGSANSEGDAERGLAVRWRHGAWQVGAGWQRWNDRTRAVPLAATAQVGHWRASLGITWGRWDGQPYRNVLIGLALRERSGAHPGELLVAVNRHDRDAPGADGWLLGLGYVYPLSRRTTLRTELAAVDPDGRATRPRAGIGIRHSFEL